jgi:glutamate--cysteine ligase
MRVGAEHEKFGFYLKDHAPVPYEGDNGVHALLTGLQRFGWKPVMEGEVIIGLERNGPMSAWSRAASSSFPARRC